MKIHVFLKIEFTFNILVLQFHFTESMFTNSWTNQKYALEIHFVMY
jgi:hypothetical protein